MNAEYHMSPKTTHTTENRTWNHVLIWVLVTVAALLLVGFTSVVDNFTERGEQRRMHQRVSGSFMLPEEIQSSSADMVRLLSMTEEQQTTR